MSNIIILNLIILPLSFIWLMLMFFDKIPLSKGTSLVFLALLLASLSLSTRAEAKDTFDSDVTIDLELELNHFANQLCGEDNSLERLAYHKSTGSVLQFICKDYRRVRIVTSGERLNYRSLDTLYQELKRFVTNSNWATLKLSWVKERLSASYTYDYPEVDELQISILDDDETLANNMKFLEDKVFEYSTVVCGKQHFNLHRATVNTITNIGKHLTYSCGNSFSHKYKVDLEKPLGYVVDSDILFGTPSQSF